MDLTRLQTLRHKLQHDKDLGQVYTYFLDHFAEEPDFPSVSVATKHPDVETILEQIVEQMFPGEKAVSHLVLSRVPDHNFVHGAFFVSGRVGGVIFFEDVLVGLVAVAESMQSANVKYARFSARPLPPLPTPSRN